MSIAISESKLIVICDYCGHQIESAGQGNIEWHKDYPDRVFFTHKRCCLAFEEAYGGRSNWKWYPLSLLPHFLDQTLKFRR